MKMKQWPLESLSDYDSLPSMKVHLIVKNCYLIY